MIEEATDQGDNFSSPSSQKTPSGSVHNQATSSNRSIDRLSQADQEPEGEQYG